MSQSQTTKPITSPMQVPHNRLTFDDAEVKAVSDVVASGQWAGGTVLAATEKKLTKIFDVPEAVCTGSGLSALRLVLLGLGVGAGDDVLVPAYSCVALANAVLSVGATPVAVDIDPVTYNMCSKDAVARKTANTTAAIVVNTFGQSCDFDLDVPVIEDCSHGFSVNPTKLNSDVAVFSFYATKLIGGGEGGAILCRDNKLADFCRDRRDYTDKEPDANRLNDKITDMEAALVGVQLDKLEALLQARYEAAQRYDVMLDIEGIQKPSLSDSRVWYRYGVAIQNGQSLNDIIEAMEAQGVSARVPVENWLGDSVKDYPNASKAFETVLSLPFYPSITVEEQQHVYEILKEVLK